MHRPCPRPIPLAFPVFLEGSWGRSGEDLGKIWGRAAKPFINLFVSFCSFFLVSCTRTRMQASASVGSVWHWVNGRQRSNSVRHGENGENCENWGTGRLLFSLEWKKEDYDRPAASISRLLNDAELPILERQTSYKVIQIPVTFRSNSPGCLNDYYLLANRCRRAAGGFVLLVEL